MRRVDIKAILNDPDKKRELTILMIMALQEESGRDADREQAERAYDNIMLDKSI